MSYLSAAENSQKTSGLRQAGHAAPRRKNETESSLATPGTVGWQRAANASVATQRLQALQRLADDGAATDLLSEEAPGTEHDRVGLSPVAARGAVGVSPGLVPAGVIAQRRGFDQRLRQRPGLRSATTLQRQPAPTGQVQRPALIGVPNTPIMSPQMDDLDVSATTMSDEAYGAWCGTMQCKMRPHGASSAGGQTIVTQYKSSSDVIQAAGFLSKKWKSFLLGAEGFLTLVAGGAAITAGITAGAIPLIIPGIMSVGVGACKMFRAYKTYRSDDPPEADASDEVKAAFQENKAKYTNLMNNVRLAESAMTAIGAVALAIGTGFVTRTSVSLMIFAALKILRSILAKFEAGEWGSVSNPKTKSRLKKAAAVIHLLEAAALFIGGAASIDAGMANAGGDLAWGGRAAIAGGAMTIAVGGGKVVRALDQAAGSGEERPAARAQGNQAATARVETGAATAPVETGAATAPVETGAATAPVETEAVTAPVETEAVTAPVEKETATAPVENEAATAPVEKEAATAPVEKEAATAPVEKEAATAPVEKEVATAPVEKEAATAPVEKEVATVPAEKEPVIEPAEEEAVVTKADEEEVSELTEEDVEQQQDPSADTVREDETVD